MSCLASIGGLPVPDSSPDEVEDHGAQYHVAADPHCSHAVSFHYRIPYKLLLASVELLIHCTQSERRSGGYGRFQRRIMYILYNLSHRF